MPYHLAMSPSERKDAYLLKISVFSHLGAEDEARTRYLHLGKVALYQMSYVRVFVFRNVDYYSVSLSICQAEI